MESDRSRTSCQDVPKSRGCSGASPHRLPPLPDKKSDRGSLRFNRSLGLVPASLDDISPNGHDVHGWSHTPSGNEGMEKVSDHQADESVSPEDVGLHAWQSLHI